MSWVFCVLGVFMFVACTSIGIAREKELERKKKKLAEDLASGRRSWMSVGLYELGDW